VLPVLGLYEVVIRVADLSRSEAFYHDILGLEVGLRDERRRMVFLRIGGQAGMLVLQEDKGRWPAQHLAFTVREADIEAARAALEERGVSITDQAFHAWMPAKSVYFSDPDGHDLELCAPVRTR